MSVDNSTNNTPHQVHLDDLHLDDLYWDDLHLDDLHLVLDDVHLDILLGVHLWKKVVDPLKRTKQDNYKMVLGHTTIILA